MLMMRYTYSLLLSLSIALLRYADRFYLWCWLKHEDSKGDVVFEDTPGPSAAELDRLSEPT